MLRTPVLRLLLFLAAGPAFLSAETPLTWQATAGPTAGPVYRLVRTHGGMLVAACGTGGVRVSTDNGASWSARNAGITDMLLRAVAVRGAYMLAGSVNGHLFVSADTGATWQLRTTLPSSVTSVDIGTALTMFAGTSGHSLYESTDLGATWHSAGLTQQFPGYSFWSVSAVYGLPLGKTVAGFTSIQGIVYTSIFPEFKWTFQFSGDRKALSFAEDPKGRVMIGWNGDITRSASPYPFQSFETLKGNIPNTDVLAVAADTSGRLFAGTGGSGVFRSVHDGARWSAVNTALPDPYIRTLVSAPDGILYAAGNGGIVYRTAASTVGIIAPTPLTAEDTVTNDGFALLRWGAVTTASTYRLQAAPDTSFAVRSTDTTLTLTAAMVHGFASKQRNYWRVRAESAAETSEFSVPRPFIAGPLPDAPALLSPRKDSAEVPPGHILFRWSAVPNALEYHLSVTSPDPEAHYTGGRLTADTTVSYYIDERSTVYDWSVRTRSIAGWGPFSAPRRFTMLRKPPLYPLLSQPVNLAKDLPRTVTLRWQRRPDTERFLLRIGTDFSFTSAVHYLDSMLTDTAVTVMGLQYSTRYYWQVFGINAGGRSNGSDIFSFFTQIAPPAAPWIVSPEISSKERSRLVSFLWNGAAADSYWVWMTNDTLDWYGRGSIGTFYGTSFQGFFDPGKDYYWRVAAFNAGGMSPWSVTGHFRTEGWSVIDRKNGNLPTTFALRQNYPNPFNAGTTFEFDVAEFRTVRLRLHSLSGGDVALLFTEILSPGTYTVRWNPAGLASGVYLCEMTAIPLYGMTGLVHRSVVKAMLVK